MKQFLIGIFFILILHGCSNPDSYSSVSISYACIDTPNLQLGEKATYKFDENGTISYLTSEVVDENDEIYTIAFNYDNEETEYYQWSKSCQSQEMLNAIDKDSRRAYILWASNFRSEFIFLKDNLDDVESLDTDEVQENPAIEVESSSSILENFTVETGTYNNVKKTLSTTQNPNSHLVLKETYRKNTTDYRSINIPFIGILKDIREYQDDFNITVELIEWNEL